MKAASLFLVALALVATCCVAQDAVKRRASGDQTAQRVLPLRTTATFTDEKQNWAIPIRKTDGSFAYILSLEPQHDKQGDVVAVELWLRGAVASGSDPNMLRLGLHGLQACDFVPSDFAHGAKNSAFGENRTVILKHQGLVLRISVTEATVSANSSRGYDLDKLTLQIEVDNL